MKDEMSYIVITSDLRKEKWIAICDRWDNQSDISLDTSLINSIEAIEYVVSMALLSKDRDLSLSVMANLAEKELISESLLEMIFDAGNQASKESVCLRSGLGEGLQNKCNSAELVHRYCHKK